MERERSEDPATNKTSLFDYLRGHRPDRSNVVARIVQPYVDKCRNAGHVELAEHLQTQLAYFQKITLGRELVLPIFSVEYRPEDDGTQRWVDWVTELTTFATLEEYLDRPVCLNDSLDVFALTEVETAWHGSP